MRILREPLLWFAVAGGLLFVIDALIPAEQDRDIVVTVQDVAHLQDLWKMQAQREPTEDELEMLIEDRVREEVMVREAQRLGLDREDVIIRRRLVQKLEFLAGDVATAVDPDESEMRDWHAENLAQYRKPPRLSFSHVYISPEGRADAQGDATRMLAELTGDDEQWRGVGDPFMLRRFYADISEKQLGDLFGRQFSESVYGLEGEGWQGPVRSGFGWHLVRVQGRRDAEDPSFESLSERLLGDWRAEQRRDAKKQWYDALRTEYTIAIEEEVTP